MDKISKINNEEYNREIKEYRENCNELTKLISGSNRSEWIYDAMYELRCKMKLYEKEEREFNKLFDRLALDISGAHKNLRPSIIYICKRMSKGNKVNISKLEEAVSGRCSGDYIKEVHKVYAELGGPKD